MLAHIDFRLLSLNYLSPAIVVFAVGVCSPRNFNPHTYFTSFESINFLLLEQTAQHFDFCRHPDTWNLGGNENLLLLSRVGRKKTSFLNLLLCLLRHWFLSCRIDDNYRMTMEGDDCKFSLFEFQRISQLFTTRWLTAIDTHGIFNCVHHFIEMLELR